MPAATPVTIPFDPTPAVNAALLLHVPPAVASVSAVAEPTHTTGVPVMIVIEVMLTVVVRVQPDGAE